MRGTCNENESQHKQKLAKLHLSKDMVRAAYL
jgi:hypothetical protein